MNVANSYRWTLPESDFAQVRAIIEQLRLHAIELGAERVGDVIVQTGYEAHAVQHEARLAVVFTAAIPGATQGWYGLAATEIPSGPRSWSWTGSVVVSGVKSIGELHAAAANLGVEVVEFYAGMVFTSKKNAVGVVEVEQRQMFDAEDF